MSSSYEHDAGTAGAKRDSNLASFWRKKKPKGKSTQLQADVQDKTNHTGSDVQPTVLLKLKMNKNQLEVACYLFFFL